jgi:cytoskeleton protein RodZ
MRSGPHGHIDLYHTSLLLKQVRERNGYSLDHVAESLRIKRRHLECIERGELDKLPGAPWSLGFVRSYASFLGLNADEVVQRCRAEITPGAGGPELNFLEPLPEKRMPGGAVVFIGAAMAISAYVGWFVLMDGGRGLSANISTLPDRLASLLQLEAAPEAPEATAEGLSMPSASNTASASVVVAGSSAATAPGDGVPGAGWTTDPPITIFPPPNTPESAPLQATNGDIVSPAAAASDPLARDQIINDPVAGLSVRALSTEVGRVDGPASAGANTPTDASVPNPTTVDPTTTGANIRPAVVVAAPLPSTPARRPAAVVDTTVSTAEPGAAAPTAPAPPSLTAGTVPRTFGLTNQNTRVKLRAVQESWVQVRGPDGEVLLTRVLRPGESYLVPNRDGVRMVTGNAGGLEVLLDGEVMPALGRPGEVLRNISLEPADLRAQQDT